ncbi:hypothetical protein PV327_011393, partial [Microctonus hyperodae]
FGIDPVLEVIVEDIKLLEKNGIFIESLNRNIKEILKIVLAPKITDYMMNKLEKLDLAKTCKNFKDIAYTLSVRHQKSMLAVWNENFKELEREPIPHNIQMIALSSIDHCNMIKQKFSITNSDFIYTTKRVEFRGANLILNKFICISVNED